MYRVHSLLSRADAERLAATVRWPLMPCCELGEGVSLRTVVLAAVDQSLGLLHERRSREAEADQAGGDEGGLDRDEEERREEEGADRGEGEEHQRRKDEPERPDADDDVAVVLVTVGIELFGVGVVVGHGFALGLGWIAGSGGRENTQISG